jgi:hypothetical protein
MKILATHDDKNKTFIKIKHLQIKKWKNKIL